MKIGVLIPQSKSYATIGKDFILGLKLHESDHSFVIEGIGIGNDAGMTLDKMEKLSFQEDVDIIVGLVGDYHLASLYEKANALELPCLFARLGAFPDLNVTGNKYAMTISYGICESLSSVGKWFTKEGYSNIATSSNFNDIGYGFVEALEKSIYAEGGTFAGHFTTPLNPRPNEKELLEEFYKTVESDAVCQLYNGFFAEEHVGYLESFSEKVETPMVFTPFALNDTQLVRVSKVASDINMVASWLPVALTGVVSEFDANYFAKNEKYPSVTAVLGYECGQAIDEILSNRSKLLAGETIEMSGPRGNGTWTEELKFENDFHIWKAESSDDKVVMKKRTSLAEEKDTAAPFEGQENGWHNAYLCY